MFLHGQKVGDKLLAFRITNFKQEYYFHGLFASGELEPKLLLLI